ncbi:MAG: hypothetical protein ACJAUC_002113, partial [Planctomycetota bacterium]
LPQDLGTSSSATNAADSFLADVKPTSAHIRS